MEVTDDIGESMSTSQYKDKYIVVFGTASLQQYIFQSNKLNENIGASDLVRYWLSDGLIEAACADTTKWNQYEDDPRIEPLDPPVVPEKDVNVIYIGGGNAALLCNDKSIAETIVKNWSCQVLKNAPGLRVVVGYSKVEDALAKAYKNALKNLASCEESLPYGSSLLSLPVVRSGLSTGQPASIDAGGQEEWVSQSTWFKRSQIRHAQKNIKETFPKVLKKTDRLPKLEEFAVKLDEELGGRKGESHIAVVHADGNGMGDLLTQVINKEYESDDDFIHYLRAFSASTSALAHNALNSTLLHFKEYLPIKSLVNPGDVFPIRPIVYGGDDLTFVCDGRVGLHIAEFYLREFSSGTIRFCGEDEPIDACAGVAIVRTKFPFFRAYSFADELCAMAKAYRRDEAKSEGSWLDFQIIQEGASKSIAALRQEQYKSLYGQILYRRPYQVPKEWGDCVEILRQFRTNWPRSRAKGLLQALSQGPDATELYVKGAQWRNKELPYVKDMKGMDVSAKTRGWTGGKGVNRSTPYFDPLEMMDYYLDELLKNQSETAPTED